MLRKKQHLPPFVYETRAGQYQVVASANNEKVIIVNTRDLEEARVVGAMVARVNAKAEKEKEKIDSASLRKFKQLRSGFFFDGDYLQEDDEYEPAPDPNE